MSVSFDLEAEFGEQQPKEKKANFNLSAIFVGLAVFGTLLFLGGYYLQSSSGLNSNANLLGGALMILGFPLLFFWLVLLGAAAGLIAIKTGPLPPKCNINEQRIRIHHRFKNKIIEWLTNLPIGRAQKQMNIPLGSLSDLKYTDYKGKKALFLKYPLDYELNVGGKFSLYLILPEENPEECYRQIESWVAKAKGLK